MPSTSRLCRLAWKRASRWSHEAGREQIEPVHFLSALHELLASPPRVRTEERDEYAAFAALGDTLGLRALEPEHGTAPDDAPRPTVQHRSARAKQLFEADADEALDLATLLRRTVDDLRRHDALPAAIRAPEPDGVSDEDRAGASDPDRSVGPALALPGFLRDLSAPYREGRAAPSLFGRRDLLLELVRVLNRKTRSNVLLLGEAGVGKTALVEMLAYRLAVGKDPYPHADPTVVELSLGGLLEGSKHRGDLENRIGQVLALCERHPNVLVFIDEVHLLAIAENGILLEHLKPALSAGTFTCIGASTPGEFHEHLAPNRAFVRRFDTIRVPEPTPDDMARLLGALVPDFERHYGTRIGADVVARLIALCDRHLRNEQFPAKAIDLLDRACATSAVAELSVAEAAEQPARVLTERHVVQVLAERTGIPEYLLHQDGRAAASIFGRVASVLSAEIVGQDEAFRHVEDTLLLAHTRSGNRAGPLCTLMLVGPSGVGKTYTAELLSDYLFGDPLTGRINLSEYTEKHAVSRLIGSPPGYEGSRRQGLLHQLLRAKPHAILLLDEIDKAHPSVYDVLLQLFDKGYTLDNDGQVVDASSTIFIMTSNLSREATLAGGTFRTEFVSRIDAVIEYAALGEPHLRTLLDRSVERLAEHAQQAYGMDVAVSDETRAQVVAEAAASGRGARALDALFRRRVELPTLRAFARSSEADDLLRV